MAMSRGGLLAGTALSSDAMMPQPGSEPQDAPEGDAEASNVSPEEQAQYDRFVKDGLALLYSSGKVEPKILQLLDDDPADLRHAFGDAAELQDFSPSVALAATTVLIVVELLKKAGNDRPEDAVILHGGKELLEELAHVAETAKIHSFTEEELNRAFYIAMDLFRETASKEGLIDTGELAQEFEAVKQADAEGAFGDQGGGMMPPPPEQPPQQPPQPEEPQP